MHFSVMMVLCDSFGVLGMNESSENFYKQHYQGPVRPSVSPPRVQNLKERQVNFSTAC